MSGSGVVQTCHFLSFSWLVGCSIQLLNISQILNKLSFWLTDFQLALLQTKLDIIYETKLILRHGSTSKDNKENNDDFKTFNTDIMRVIYCGSSDFPISTRFGALWIPEFDRIWYSLLYFEYTCLCLTKSENGR